MAQLAQIMAMIASISYILTITIFLLLKKNINNIIKKETLIPILIAFAAALTTILLAVSVKHEKSPKAAVARGTIGAEAAVEPPSPSNGFDPGQQPIASPIEVAKRQLRAGRFVFNPTYEMREGEVGRISVRVSPDNISKITEGLQGIPELRAIKVGPVMRAVLEGQPEEFSIRRVGEERKVVDDSPFTQWSWDVTPLESGSKRLDVLVYAILLLGEGKEQEQVEVFTGQARIQVRVWPPYVVGKFVQGHWEWFVGSPLAAGGLAWIVSRLKKRRERRVGFE